MTGPVTREYAVRRGPPAAGDAGELAVIGCRICANLDYVSHDNPRCEPAPIPASVPGWVKHIYCDGAHWHVLVAYQRQSYETLQRTTLHYQFGVGVMNDAQRFYILARAISGEEWERVTGHWPTSDSIGEYRAAIDAAYTEIFEPTFSIRCWLGFHRLYETVANFGTGMPSTGTACYRCRRKWDHEGNLRPIDHTDH